MPQSSASSLTDRNEHVETPPRVFVMAHRIMPLGCHDRYVNRDAGILYILVEYCGGGDLSAIIKHAMKQSRLIPEDTIWQSIRDGGMFGIRNQVRAPGAFFCPEGVCRERIMLPGGCSSELKMLISSRRQERLGRVQNKFGRYIPKISG